MNSAAELIEQFNLLPHPEGGWYRENYKSSESISREALPERFTGNRAFSTAIYFLLEQGDFSAFHRLKSDECWHFYEGDPLEIFVIEPDGKLEITILGNHLTEGAVYQYVVPANCWFASRPAKESRFCFVGCTVAPGFDFADFEMAVAEGLSLDNESDLRLVRALCRP
ncbi:MAG: cupin domain-containing protein [Chitinophagaceae bacterium]|nr:cupin domain-containing protein [Chitinophagaceae bacterium]MBL0055317.1 cupin domain-containing protein [Chitinophagaceae bacterium]